MQHVTGDTVLTCLMFTLTVTPLRRLTGWNEIIRVRRLIELTAFLCLVPLAITSTSGWVRRLGGKRWQRLHRLVYVAAAAGVLHYFWLVKKDVEAPLSTGRCYWSS